MDAARKPRREAAMRVLVLPPTSQVEVGGGLAVSWASNARLVGSSAGGS